MYKMLCGVYENTLCVYDNVNVNDNCSQCYDTDKKSYCLTDFINPLSWRSIDDKEKIKDSYVSLSMYPMFLDMRSWVSTS